MAPCGSRIDGSRKRSPMEDRGSLSKGCSNCNLTGVRPFGILETCKLQEVVAYQAGMVEKEGSVVDIWTLPTK